MPGHGISLLVSRPSRSRQRALAQRTPLGGKALSAFGANLALDRDRRRGTQQTLRFQGGTVLVMGDKSAGIQGDAQGNQIDIARDLAAALTHDNHPMGLGGNDMRRRAGGDSLLEGGQGNDSIIGGAGRDAFVFPRVAHLIDRIKDFHAGQVRIDPRALSDLGHWIGTAEFGGGAGEVRMTPSGEKLLIAEDISGAGMADLTLDRGTAQGLGADDFLF